MVIAKKLIVLPLVIVVTCVSIGLSSCKNSNSTSSSPPLPNVEEGQLFEVVHIDDGDSFIIQNGGQQFKIRITSIDAPESQQPYGDKSRDALKEILQTSDWLVQLPGRKKDQYGRTLSEVFTKDGTNVGLWMVENGWAFHFLRYCDRKDYAEAQNRAESARRGAWAQGKVVWPWEFRRKN